MKIRHRFSLFFTYAHQHFPKKWTIGTQEECMCRTLVQHSLQTEFTHYWFNDLKEDKNSKTLWISEILQDLGAFALVRLQSFFGPSWLRINKSTDIQMHTFYAIQIHVVYQRMHSRKKLLLFLQNYFSAMKLFSPGSKHTATITHCFWRRRCFSYHSTRKKSLEIKFQLSWLSSWSYLWSVWCIQLIESCLPDGFAGVNKQILQ